MLATVKEERVPVLQSTANRIPPFLIAIFAVFLSASYAHAQRQPSDKERIAALEQEVEKLQQHLKELLEALNTSNTRISAMDSAVTAARVQLANAVTTLEAADKALQTSTLQATELARGAREGVAQTLNVAQNALKTAQEAVQQVAAANRVTGTSFLTDNETPGYGLYSYLLFASRPTPTTKERYDKALLAWLSLPSAQGLLREQLPKELLNIFYVPTKSEPLALTLDEVWASYNYERAVVLLNKIPGEHSTGPYLVSTLAPLSAGKPPQYIFQDLSTVPPHVVILWIREFQQRAAQERPWSARMLPQFLLNLRTAVAQAATALGHASNTLAWIRTNVR
jgi:hypothetical protein